MAHPLLGDVVLPSSPLRFSDTPDPEVRVEPELGEHTDVVLGEWLGLGDERIAALRKDGVVA